MRERIKVTVTQLSPEDGLEMAWQRLVAHVRSQNSDLVLLPEMPFYPWPFAERPFRPAVWEAAEAAHDTWLLRLSELAPAVVASSRPVTLAGKRLNEAFLWETAGGYHPLHHKQYLPDEPGFWEASWYERGANRFAPVEVSLRDGTPLSLGVLICTELWFMEHARAYGQQGVHLLLNPRATERQTRARWRAGGTAAAIISGAYTLSANHFNRQGHPWQMGGQGWIIDPEGEVLALTDEEEPFATVAVAVAVAESAKKRYPRYVKE